MFRWNGERWRRAWAGDAHGILNDVVVPAPGVVWGVGSRSSEVPYQPLIVRLRPDGWHASAIRGAEGWLWGIDGTPNNLWLTHSYMVDPHGSEPTYFDTYHRC